MAILTSQISVAQRDRILAIEEGHFADVKAIEIRPAKLSEVISAFANADGGELYVGIDEDKTTNTRSWRGFPTEEAANGHLQIFEQLFPLGQEFEYSFLECAGSAGKVLQVQVHKTNAITKASDGTPYIRRGAQKLPVKTHEEYKRLEYSKGLVSFETEVVECDSATITNSTHIIHFMLNVIPTAEPDTWLRKQQVLKGNRPAVAGLLLFAEEPQAVLPKRCGIKLYRYKTSDKEGTRETMAFDPVNVEGCIYDQIKDAVQQTISTVEQMKILGDEELEDISYPRETLHEIITNAVLHRDYSIADDVHIRVFDNRIEVESPGRLPAHVTPENILRERFARNGIAVRLINKFPDPPNKDIGEGLNTAFEAMKKLHLKEPVVTQRENSVLVIIRHEPLASPEEIVMTYLTSNQEINNSKGRELCHIGSENAMKRVFQRLMKRGLIERIPGREGPSAAYQKVAK